MNWEPVYALLIFGSTAITYFCSILVDKYDGHDSKRKLIFVASLIVNFGILFIFKYYNFINASIFEVLDIFGLRWNMPNFEMLLPVGISFYTFQAIGYTFDVYKKKVPVEKSFFKYALFVAFFPQLVAGPIERVKSLLPQFYQKHVFSYDRAISGLKQMLWGYFMKLCVADRLSIYVDGAYNNAVEHNGTTLMVATFLFAFQIYCDFGGYSNIAIGASRIMGFDLMENFRRPYLAQSIKEFWKRWHISLSTWFQDYVYIPLGGNRVPYGRHLLNLVITFILSGVWHGANWTFVLWGTIHGCFLVIQNVSGIIDIKIGSNVITKFLRIIFCFILVSFALIFFRSNSIDDAIMILDRIFTQRGTLFIDNLTLSLGLLSLIILLMKDIVDEYNVKFNFLNSKNQTIQFLTFIALIFYVLLFGVFDGGQFIYFQF